MTFHKPSPLYCNSCTVFYNRCIFYKLLTCFHIVVIFLLCGDYCISFRHHIYLSYTKSFVSLLFFFFSSASQKKLVIILSVLQLFPFLLEHLCIVSSLVYLQVIVLPTLLTHCVFSTIDLV